MRKPSVGRKRELPPSARQRLEHQLRELVAFYEWSEPPNIAVADTLQAAADAVKHGELSIEAASMTVAVWRPFVGLDANAGTVPETYEIATDEETLQRRIIEDIRGMIARTTNTARRMHLARLMEKQIQNFEGWRDENRTSLRAS
jgi:hypothetical protein